MPQSSYTVTNRTANAGSSVKIRRSEWLLWVVCIVCGLITGPVFAEYAASFLNGEFELGIPYEACMIAMMIIGGIIGGIISFLAREAYMTAYNGWPWLLLGLTVPIATLAAVALLTLAIGLIVGVIYLILSVIVLVLMCGFCSGG